MQEFHVPSPTTLPYSRAAGERHSWGHCGNGELLCAYHGVLLQVVNKLKVATKS